jgi:hypothetical protein
MPLALSWVNTIARGKKIDAARFVWQAGVAFSTHSRNHGRKHWRAFWGKKCSNGKLGEYFMYFYVFYSARADYGAFDFTGCPENGLALKLIDNQTLVD